VLQVLLLAEVERLVELMTAEGFATIVERLADRLALSIANQYAQIAQRALQFWKNSAFLKRSALHAAQLMPKVVPVCYRGNKLHWNTTVNRLSAGHSLDCVPFASALLGFTPLPHVC
jgi:hypothetical protein